MTTLTQIASKIIKEQELIVGPIAWIQAGKVSGIPCHPLLYTPAN